MLDFTNKTELGYLAELTRAFNRAVGNLPYYLAGATARDLLLEHAHNINPGRDTTDIDLAIMLPDWATYERVRQALIEQGAFNPLQNKQHKLLFNGVCELDLIPFGAIEQADRTIAWPPDGAMVMGVFGFREAYQNTVEVLLPGGEQIRIVSLAALYVLKLFAWQERRRVRPGADAHDIAVILHHYLDAGNWERLYTEAAELLDAEDFDYEQAGAWLLGQDMARLLPESAHSRVVKLLTQESDAMGGLSLVGDLPMDASRALKLLQNVALGFGETSSS